MKFAKFLDFYQKRVQIQLQSYLPSINQQPTYLHKAMHYAVLNGGKRIRPLLVYATGLALQIPLEVLDELACAIEYIHCYSLIHDDLPAMDNDDFRRGQPSCHKKFNEATALLAGNTLLTHAIRILSQSHYLTATLRIKLILSLLDTLESKGLVGGQALEFDPYFKVNNLEDIETIHSLKTAALIKTAISLPVMVKKNLNLSKKNALLEFGQCIGLAFQITDDLQDWDSEKNSAHKKESSILNYVAFAGIDKAKQRIEELYQQALAAISIFGDEIIVLRELSNYLLSR